MSQIESNLSPGVAVPPIASLTSADLGAALAAGWRDFLAAPLFGLFFASVYVAGGLALYFGLIGSGQPVWFVFIAAGFPLFAPFAAIGLYEVSRRREAGAPLAWGPVLSALKGKGDGQLPMMAATVLIAFGFWIILARGIFAIFMAQSGVGFDDLGALLAGAGLPMLAVGTLVGAALALVVFAITAFSLPMLLDRPTDMVTALVTSVLAVRRNGAVMLRWAAIIVVLTVIAMIPAFLGLFLVLPILGHASWHLYRKAIGES